MKTFLFQLAATVVLLAVAAYFGILTPWFTVGVCACFLVEKFTNW